MTRAGLIALARQWRGTPFVDGASVPGMGMDCAGLVEALATAAGLAVAPRRPGRTLAEGLATHLLPAPAPPRPGDVLLLARDPGGPGVHAALFSGAGTILHVHWSRGLVENGFGGWFSRRLVSVHAFPGVAPWHP